MSDRPLPPRLRIVVAGHGIEAWMTVAALAATLPENTCELTLVTGDAGTPAAAGIEATLPVLEPLAPALAIDEDLLAAERSLAFSFGIALQDFHARDAAFFHGFADPGAALDTVPFHLVAARLRQAGESLRLADYSLAALAAQAGRFRRPGDDPRSVLSTCRYGLHLDLDRLADEARRRALAAGVRVVDEPVADVATGEDGRLLAIDTRSGRRIGGDLFVDCGERASPLAAPEDRWRDWSTSLPCNRIVAGRIAAEPGPPPYSFVAATPGGFLRRVPLPGTAGVAAWYRRDALSDDAALARLATFAGRAPDSPTCTARTAGRLDAPWRGNRIALGAAAVAIEPLAASDFDLFRWSLNRLLGLLPGAPGSLPVLAAEYNRQVTGLYDQARDFAQLHYLPATTPGKQLAWRLELYRGRGRLPLADEEPFAESSWIGVLDAFGVVPRAPGVRAAGLTLAACREHAAKIRTVMIDALRAMPAHADYLGARRIDRGEVQ